MNDRASATLNGFGAHERLRPHPNDSAAPHRAVTSSAPSTNASIDDRRQRGRVEHERREERDSIRQLDAVNMSRSSRSTATFPRVQLASFSRSGRDRELSADVSLRPINSAAVSAGRTTRACSRTAPRHAHDRRCRRERPPHSWTTFERARRCRACHGACARCALRGPRPAAPSAPGSPHSFPAPAPRGHERRAEHARVNRRSPGWRHVDRALARRPGARIVRSRAARRARTRPSTIARSADA